MPRKSPSMAGATGEFRPFAGAPTLAFDNSFGEVLDDLDAAFFAHALIRRDRFVATRINAQVAPRLATLIQGDVGGFGVGSDFTYQVTGTINYTLSDGFVISAGWRHLHLDYESDGTRFEGSQTGPLIGVTHRF